MSTSSCARPTCATSSWTSRPASSTARSARSDTCPRGPIGAASSSASTPRSDRAVASPGTSSSSTRRIAARIDGEWQEQNGIRHRVDQFKHDNRLDVTLESGDAISLWWLNRSEWEGLIEVAGFEVEALYGGFERQPFDENANEFVWVVRKPSPYDAIARVYDPWSASVTEDVEFYVAEARASGGPVVELACGTGRISIPIAKAGIRADRRRRVGRDARGRARSTGEPKGSETCSISGSATCATRR